MNEWMNEQNKDLWQSFMIQLQQQIIKLNADKLTTNTMNHEYEIGLL